MTDANRVPCSQVLGALWAFIDCEPASIDRVEIERHLEWCAPCAQESAIEANLKALIGRALCAGPAPARLRSRVTAQITRIEVQISRVTPPVQGPAD